ncbi:transmembrane protein 131-like isoform X4 [Leptotrombidium deliense]|uniref:Transmembrane protein 131-like isoform X4 n=1 Tax=Leptotrombidium deliense TaxID=299467 RepID=A0A443SUD2_9ACAR|nr:transmembrane protein 131-like isoform X4 [Leptotrombidium deliense]
MCTFGAWRLLMSAVLVVFCSLNKLIAIIVMRNVLGLPVRVNSAVFTVLTKVLCFSFVGIPYIRKVIVENLQEDTSLQMLSISGNSVHFHCSFFEDKIVHSQSNTSFDVVFLARQEGFVSNTLYIHTSIGSFKYQVSAIGVANPYRLRPLVGAKVPLNSSYSPVIHIYNPHSSTLQLTEMYSTGGGLHLELPTGTNDAPKQLWQIPPFETKAIMKANFLARSEKNHTAYIRIKTNASDEETKELILPVEVEVSAAPGIYSPVDVLDFGVTRSIDESLELSLQILNAGTKTITIQNVIATPVNEALDIEFSSVNPVRVLPNIYHPTEIAKLRLEPKRITNCWKQCAGKIVVKSKNNQYKLTIPYQVTLLSGFLGYNQSHTQFYIPPSVKDEERRVLNVISYFNFSLVIHSVSLPDEAKPYFKVTLIESPVNLSPNETRELATISFTPSQQLTRLQTHFRLHTNISHFDILLSAYSGKLQVFVPQSLNQTFLDFGTIGLKEEKSMVFSLVNNNPVDVRLKNWGSNISKAHVDLIGIEEGNVTAIAQKTNFSNFAGKNILKLKPKHFAIFKLHLTGFSEESNFYGETFVETDFEVLKVSFIGRAIEGSLVGENVFIVNSFPGRVSSQSVRIGCSYTSGVTLKSVTVLPKDETRFTFEPLVNGVNGQTSLEFGENLIGKLYFDPYKSCGHSKTCYTGLETSKEGKLFFGGDKRRFPTETISKLFSITPTFTMSIGPKENIDFFDLVGHLWLLGLALHPDTGYIDKELHKLFYTRWTSVDSSSRLINASLEVVVDSGQQITLDVQSTLQWPRLVHGAKNYLKFPISKIGNTTVKEITIENPSSQPILVQLVLLSDYPSAEAAIQCLSRMSIWTESEIKQAETSPKSFHLIDPNGYSMPSSSSSETANIQRIKNTFAVTPAQNSLTLVMPVGHRTRIAVGFTPQYVTEDPLNYKSSDSPQTSSTFLLIRNNLTIFDAIHLSGEGGSGLLKLGNHLPGLNSLLSFDVQEKHLSKSCKKQTLTSSAEPVFTVHKSFNLVNYGKLPIKISGFLIGPPMGAIATVSLGGRKSGVSEAHIRSMGANKYLNHFIGHSLCQGFGFKVLNCDVDDEDLIQSKKGSKDANKVKPKKTSTELKEHTFILRPNDAKKIHIAFTPDFALARTSAILTILTDDDDIEKANLYLEPSQKNKRIKPIIQYSLVANVPKQLLPICSEAIPRPYWELILYYTLVIFMICLHMLSVVSAFFDGARILNFSFYPAIVLTKAVSSNSTNGDQMENIELIQHIMDGNKEKMKKVIDNKNAKQKKTAKEQTRNTKKSQNADVQDDGSTVDGASWTAYLKKKFVRRDSSGSDKSSSNGGRKQKDKKKNEIKRKENVPHSKEKLNGDSTQNAPSKRKLNAKSWFSSLSSSSSQPVEPPPPLPSFPSAFDDEDDDKLSTKGKGKKGKLSNSNSGNVNSQTDANSLELPYKPAKHTKSQLKKNNKIQDCKSSKNVFDNGMDTWSNSSDSNSSKVIWDLPITMFDTEKAMSELVKHTETFAKEKRAPNKPSLNKDVVETKSSLCSFDSPNISFADSMNTRHKDMEVTPKSFQQEIQRPKPSLTPPAWRMPSSISPSNSFRSSTPPVVPSGVVPFDDLTKRRTPTSTAYYLERQSCGITTPTSTSAAWITDTLLDNELSYLKESNSGWNNVGSHCGNNHSLHSQRSDTRDQLPQESRLKEWTRFGGVDLNLNAGKLWENSAAPANLSINRNVSSQSVWNNEPKSSAWGTAAGNADSWFSTINDNGSTASSSSVSPSSSQFSLFGKSLWTPITATETGATQGSSLGTSVINSNTSGSQWSFNNLLNYSDVSGVDKNDTKPAKSQNE